MPVHAPLSAFFDDICELGQAVRSRRFWRTVTAMAVGLTLFAVAVHALLIPHHLSASGATGIALALYYLFGWPQVGVYYWLINVPILLLGWRVLSLEFVFVALLGVALSGATLQLIQGIGIVIFCPDPMMASILAGFLSGLGVGFYLRYGGSAGGLDVVAMVLRRKLGVAMGQTFLTVNLLNVASAGLLGHSLERAFYTAIAVFVHARMVDKMQSGFSARKAALIITCEPDKLAQEILRTLRRGCTFFFASGGMTQKQTRVVYTVVNFMELARLKEILYTLDPKAFLAVTTTEEVIGNRFITWEDEGFAKRRRRLRAAGLADKSPSQLPDPQAKEGRSPAAATETK